MFSGIPQTFAATNEILPKMKVPDKIFAKTINTLEYLLYQSQLLGLATFSFTEKKFKPSKIRCCFNILAVIIYFPMSMYAVYLIAFCEGPVVIEKTTDIIQLIVNSIYLVTIWTWSIMNRDNFTKFLTSIVDFDIRLFTTGTTIDYAKNRKELMIQLVLRYVTLTITIGALVTFALLKVVVHEMFSETLSYNTLVINSAVCHLTVELILMLRARFTILNNDITGLINFFKKAPITTIDGNQEKTNKEQLMTLNMICALHHHLSKMVKLFNETFGVILLLMFGVSFVSIVVSLFYCTSGLQAYKIDWVKALIPLLSSFTLVVDITYVCNACYTTIEEANRSGELIHKIETENHDIRDEIEMFSLQIANEQVEFNAAGFFPINFTLLFSIIGGVTTYIIILLQLSATLVAK